MKLTSPLVAVTKDVTALFPERSVKSPRAADSKKTIHLAVGVVESSAVITVADDIKCENGSMKEVIKGGDILSKNFILKCFGRWQKVDERNRSRYGHSEKSDIFTRKASVQPFN